MNDSNNAGCLVIFMIPFILAGIGFTLAIPIRLFVQLHGTPITAIVDGKQISTSSKHNSHTYHVKFHYTFNGQTLNDQQQVSENEYDKAHVGERVAGHAMMLLKWPVCVAEVGSVFGMTVTFAVLWDGFLVLFLSIFLLPLAREKRLVSQGTPAPGTITDHRIVRGKSTIYFISYNFKTTDGTDMMAEKAINRSLYDSAKIGSAVTVLYDPAKPKRSVPYEFSNYEVVPLVG